LVGSGGKSAEQIRSLKSVVPLSLEYVFSSSSVAVTVISPSVAVAQLKSAVLYEGFTAVLITTAGAVIVAQPRKKKKKRMNWHPLL
jgi:hypothetical protein